MEYERTAEGNLQGTQTHTWGSEYASAYTSHGSMLQSLYIFFFHGLPTATTRPLSTRSSNRGEAPAGVGKGLCRSRYLRLLWWLDKVLPLYWADALCTHASLADSQGGTACYGGLGSLVSLLDSDRLEERLASTRLLLCLACPCCCMCFGLVPLAPVSITELFCVHR